MTNRTFAATLGLIAFSLSPLASAAISTFVVPLDGHQEIDAGGLPDAGDLDGTGTATLIIDDVANTIEWEIVVHDIALPPTGAHIHQAAAGANGPVRIDFNAQLSGTGLADPDLATLLADPDGFYINIHNAQFPLGAVRGQLSAPGGMP